MTTQPDAPAASAGQAGGRPRRPIAAFDNYGDAERVVDYLSDNGFPVNRVAIIGSDVRMVEQIVGRMNYGGAALRGAPINVNQSGRLTPSPPSAAATRACCRPRSCSDRPPQY